MPLLSLMGLAGLIELGTGLLIAGGFLTRPAAFMASGEMACAYWFSHAPLMPAPHRHTYGAVYEIALVGACTVQPFLAFLLADHPNAFRLLALPGGLALFVVPVLVYSLILESPRWQLRIGHPQAAVDSSTGSSGGAAVRRPRAPAHAGGPRLPLEHRPRAAAAL